jgi:hypothetical protein
MSRFSILWEHQYGGKIQNPGWWWVPGKVGHCLQTDLPCRSYAVQVTWLSGASQGQCCNRNPERMTYRNTCQAQPECNNGVRNWDLRGPLRLQKWRPPSKQSRPSVLPIFSLTHTQMNGSSLTQTQVYRVGPVLSQIQEVQEQLTIAYYSETLNQANRNYCVTRPELLIIVRTLEQLHKYFYRKEFHLRTHHSALT